MDLTLRSDQEGLRARALTAVRENPCERLYRYLPVDRIWEGTSEIQRLIIANEVSKRGLNGTLSHGAAAALVGEPAGT